MMAASRPRGPDRNAPGAAVAARRKSAWPPALQQAHAQLVQRWDALAPRERTGAAIAMAAVAILLLWLVAVQPAVKTLGSVPLQRAEVDRQLARMQVLANEARELRAQPPLAPDQAEAALRAATARLGAGARLNLGGDRATVTLTAVDPAALAAWLAEVRSGARARVVELQINRIGTGYGGSVVLAMGPAR